ncbi:hypothetical protein CW749_09755 [Vibrio sp. vnigr-6D03]|uniref:FG-GAP repeat protein n=1 Tax=Vibrio sp. vnigr-6D03 TaxID=2058088 RepID=UPI000C3481CB|nr:FG-GAP repeat protein [Vibrio sp. vnigr-6D03]PKF79972.1 hypothetical protein CW749_09755 [Vibrio sp. vnigr-6D03]
MNNIKLSRKYGKYLLVLPALLLMEGCGGGSSSTQSSSQSAPSAFNLLDVTALSSEMIFYWDKASGTTTYSLCLKDESKPNSCHELAKTSELSITVPNTGVINNLTSTYFVRATNSKGSQFSNEKSLTPDNFRYMTQHVKASNTGSRDYFGYSVSLSADGKTLAVSAPFEESNSKGINSDGQDDNSASDSGAGAVYVYRFAEGKWAQQAYIKASNTGSGDKFGFSVSLSSDGNTLAVGALGEDSAGTGINSSLQNDNSARNAGAVYLYHFDGGRWSQQAYLKASNAEKDDEFGYSVSLSSDGNTLAVGAPEEASSSKGVNSGLQNDNRASGAGAVYVFRNNGGGWAQQAYVKASNTWGNEWFGFAVSLSADGNSLAVGAGKEDSSGTGVNSDTQFDNNASYSGAVYLYQFEQSIWTQQAYIKASNTGTNDGFGRFLSLSSDGKTLAVGALHEDSLATGINSSQDDDHRVGDSGAVYLYRLEDSDWTQQAYIKASNTGPGHLFSAVSLSSDGNTLVVGAWGENSDAYGVNSDLQNSVRASNSGAAYLFRFESGIWSQHAYIKASNPDSGDEFGHSVSISSDGNVLAIGAYSEDSSGEGVNRAVQHDNRSSDSGAVYIY